MVLGTSALEPSCVTGWGVQRGACVLSVWEIFYIRFYVCVGFLKSRTVGMALWKCLATGEVKSLQTGCSTAVKIFFPNRVDAQICIYWANSIKWRNCSALNKWHGRFIPNPFALGPVQTSAQLLSAFSCALGGSKGVFGFWMAPAHVWTWNIKGLHNPLDLLVHREEWQLVILACVPQLSTWGVSLVFLDSRNPIFELYETSEECNREERV